MKRTRTARGLESSVASLIPGLHSVCEFRACRITCMCNHILNDYAFGDSGQWIILDVFSMVCMLLTAFFILYSIRWNRIQAVKSNTPRAGVVFPVYSKVMLGLAIVYLYDAIVWFMPPLLDWGVEPMQRHIINVLQIVKGGIGEAIIEAIFLFLLQEGAGWDELRAAGYGGALCGLVFGGANFLTRAPKFGIHLSKTGCIGYGKQVLEEKCWGNIFINIYTMAVWVLYTFAYCSRYIPCVKWQPQRPAIYRLLFCAIVLRTVDLLILANPCFDVASTILWSIWFQLGLYYCFRADTDYFKKPIYIQRLLSEAPCRQIRTVGMKLEDDGKPSNEIVPVVEDLTVSSSDPSLPLLSSTVRPLSPPNHGHRRSETYGSVNTHISSVHNLVSKSRLHPSKERKNENGGARRYSSRLYSLKLRRLVARGATSLSIWFLQEPISGNQSVPCASLTRKTQVTTCVRPGVGIV